MYWGAIKERVLRQYLRLRFGFVRNKDERRILQNSYLNDNITTRYKKQKWGVSYSVFDGEELLEASIRSIRAHVDYINVVWQKLSWYGKPANDGLLPLLNRLKKEKLIDELIEFIPNLSKKSIKNETKKRNIGLAAARCAGVTYFMSMDTDEFYHGDEIETAKRYIIEHRITHSYCAQVTYGTRPTQMLVSSMCCCQFFSLLTRCSKHINDSHSIALVDPSRKLRHIPWYLGGSKYYFLHLVRMHHYSLIRKDLNKKFNNSSWQEARKDAECRLEQSLEISCPDYFHINEIF